MKAHPLSRQAIKEFKSIYQEEFGQSLADEEAQEIALPVLSLFRILLQPESERTPAKDSVPQWLH